MVGGLSIGPSVLALGCRRDGSTATPAATPPPSDAGLEADLTGGDAGLEAAAQPVVLADPRQDGDVRLDLIEHLHLADVHHHGTFIDFGTPAQHKYTLGSWRTGWGEDGEEEGGVRFNWAAASPGRLYFHLDRPQPLRLRLRVRPRSSDRITFYVNDDAVDHVDLPRGWSEQEIQVERRYTDAGENSLKLAHRSRSDNSRSFAIDWLRIIPGDDEAELGQLPRVTALRRPVTIGEEIRPTLTLRAPTRLSYYVQIPPDARLVFSAGLLEGEAATATVRITTARAEESRELYSGQLRQGREGWQNHALDLGDAAGQLARIDLEASAEDEATVALATPAIVTRPRPLTALPESRPRHVVVLLIDTLRADKLQTYGRTRVETPQIDRFVQGATVFDRCQAPANWTKPSCASVLTGLHPPSHRALTDSGSLPSRIPMVSEAFQRAGFSTAAMIANGYMAADFGFDRGWDLYRNYIRERLQTEAEHVFEEAAGWMEEHREERMMVYIQTIDPHVPYDPPDEDLRRYDADAYSGPVRNRSTGNLLEDIKRGRVEMSARDRRRLEALYDGEVTYHDRHFGRFVSRLSELGLLDETFFVITADHGEEFFEHDSVGHGHSLYQELLHVPLILRSPGLAPEGQRLGQVCSLVDIAPTILDACGLEVPDELEGRSLVPDLRGGHPPANAAAFSSQWDTGNHRELGWTARLNDWKLRMRGPAITYLYDLENDPGEQRDMDERHPIALRAARVALGQFLGASYQRSWAAPPATRRRPPRPQPEQNEAQMTPDLCAQLRALGYMDACE